MTATTLNGDDITVDLSDGVKINTSTVTTADVAASNGVIHVIDAVLVPSDIDVAAFLKTCEMKETRDIPTVATDNGSFGTLVAALAAADLVAPLSKPNGPLTVFAPTDDAFAALPDGLVDCLLKPGNKETLGDILKYHVVNKEVLSTDLTDKMTATTLNGDDITVDLSDGVKINTSTVTTADVAASNGVIHVIDAVLVPSDIDVAAFLKTCEMKETRDIPTVATDNGSFGTLVAALAATDLVVPLSEPNGNLTVFAPTDDAFAALPDGLVDCLLKPGNKETLG